MPRQRRKREEPQQRDATRVMFLALNMILLAFFILLVALSQPDRTREAELAIEVKKAFQSFGGAYLGLGRFLEQRGVSRERNPLESSREVEQFLGELTRFVEANEEAQEISYAIRSDGMAVHLSNDLLFPEGRAELRRQAVPLLRSLRRLILNTTNPVRIEGHTDNRELRTDRFRNNWALSAARAMAVFRYFIEAANLPPERFTVVGHGAQRPLATNLTASGRAENRRVTVTLMGQLRRVGAGQGEP